MIDGVIDIVILLVVLVGLVLLHELGHFVTAKRAGVKVHEFGIGFPPRAAVLFKRGDTTYTLNWLPIGGFVRMEGEEPSPAEGGPRPEPESLDPRAFVNQRLRTRLWILVAGVLVNFVVAWLIFTLIALVAQPTTEIRIGKVLPDSPAEAAGLIGGEYLRTDEVPERDADGDLTGEILRVDRYDASGDLIVAIDGQAFPVFDDMSRADTRARPGPLQYLQDRPERTVVLTLLRPSGELEDVEATLRTEAEIEAEMGALGFLPQGFEYGERTNGPIESMVIGLERTLEASTLILRGVGALIEALLTGDQLPVAGPLGLTQLIGVVREAAPPAVLLWFVGLLSANLAVINALPFPPLDGGRITMALVQAVSRNGVSPATERMVYLTGFVLLMTLLLIVTFSDASRMFS
jgi:regulator of sigma E protease